MSILTHKKLPCFRVNILLSLILTIIFTYSSYASADCAFSKDDSELGILGGYGYNFSTSNNALLGRNVSEDIESIFLIPYWGKIIREWDNCINLEFMTEGYVSYFSQESKDRYAVGATPYFQINFQKVGKVIPFIGLGAGVFYTDLDPAGFGAEFNFSPQAGAGIRYEIDTDRFLLLSYRYHHISNADTEDSNRSIDSNYFILGFSTK